MKTPNLCISPLLFLFTFAFLTSSSAQDDYIHSKEGTKMVRKMGMIMHCLATMHKSRFDKEALAICQCRIDMLDRHFTLKQYSRHTIDGVINLNDLIEEDTLLKARMQYCFTASGKTVLLEAEGFQEQFVANCRKAIQKSTERRLDSVRLTDFCQCQMEMVLTKKLTDDELRALSDPNSLLFYEVMYKCGNPFITDSNMDNSWTEASAQDIVGPASDTVRILTIEGMTFIKARMGSLEKVWLFDTGASDLLINSDIEASLKKENIITTASYRGTGKYEMANGMVDTCRKYLINGLKIGRYTLNNLMVAVTDKGKKIIVGKGLLNKFSSWAMNNKENILVLNR